MFIVFMSNFYYDFGKKFKICNSHLYWMLAPQIQFFLVNVSDINLFCSKKIRKLVEFSFRIGSSFLTGTVPEKGYFTWISACAAT